MQQHLLHNSLDYFSFKNLENTFQEGNGENANLNLDYNDVHNQSESFILNELKKS